MDFKWSVLNKPIIALAPMANITTLPFRSICREMGADVVFTPMISSNAIIHNTEKTLKIAEFLASEQPVIVQIFGYNGELIAKAANIVKDRLGPAGIDINLGCPAPKITGNECGSALLRDYAKSLEIVKYVRDHYDGQLSVKLRLGWDKPDVLSFAKELENIGIDAISVHGRTTKQGYSGEPNWIAIEEIAQAVKIPVIGNGDIADLETAKNRLATNGISGIMIGRAALGNPWIFESIQTDKDRIPNRKEIAQIIRRQTLLSIKYLGDEKLALREMRKHICWYIRDFPGSKDLRKQAVQVESLGELDELLLELTPDKLD